MNMSKNEYVRLKQNIKEWIVSINENEKIPEDITAINFGLFEPYGIELIGSKVYDEEDQDWACEEDFVPRQRACPDFKVNEDMNWEEFLADIIQMLNELTTELTDLGILKVEHITTGFCDGDIEVIR